MLEWECEMQEHIKDHIAYLEFGLPLQDNPHMSDRLQVLRWLDLMGKLHMVDRLDRVLERSM